MNISELSDKRDTRIKQLETELDEMTIAVAHAWDQLANLLNTSPASSEPSQDASSIVTAIMTAMDATMGSIFLIEQDVKTVQHIVIPSNAVDPDQILQCLGNISQLAKIQKAEQLPTWDGYSSHWLFAPIHVNYDVVGVIGVGRTHRESEFTASEVRILLRMTERAAGQIAESNLALSHEREQRYAHDMEIAGLIQRSLQPLEFPNLSCIDIAAHWQPAQNVGGDAWGWVQQPSGSLACFILDVAGKGIPASLAAVSLHTAIKMALRLGLDPVDVLRTVNDEVYDSYTNANLIATATILTYQPDTRELKCTSAGHPPTLIKTQNEWLSWRANFPPLGMLPKYVISSSSSYRLSLNPADLVICFSDGYTEIEVANQLWGVQGIRDAVPDQVENAEQVAVAVQDKANLLEPGGILHDDQTLLVLRVNEQ